MKMLPTGQEPVSALALLTSATLPDPAAIEMPPDASNGGSGAPFVPPLSRTR
jgi:hypothetical protein